MVPAELLFLLSFVGCIVWLGIIGVRLVGGRRAAAFAGAKRLAAAMAAYMGIVVVASLASPQRWVALGEEQRFDDWAITVLGAHSIPSGLEVRIQVANRGRGRTQRAADAEVRLVTADGTHILPDPTTPQRSLRSEVAAGDSFRTVLTFAVPGGTPVHGLDVVHGTGPPAWFIIGDRSSLFHKRPLVRLP